MGYSTFSMAGVSETYEKLSNITQERCHDERVLSEARSIIAEVHLCLIQWMQRARSVLSENNTEADDPTASIFFTTVAKCIELLEGEQERLSDGHSSIMDTILKITAIFQELKMHHGDKTFHELELHVLATSIVCPMLKYVYCKWQPLKEPWCGIGLLKAWKIICENNAEPPQDGSEMKRGDSLYDWFISSTVLPAIMNLVENWDVLETQPFLSCVLTWQKTFPHTVMDHILNAVAGKLQTNVMEIVFNAGTVASEGMVQWLKPWEAVMPEKIVALRRNIYTSIQNTVASNTWSPIDKCSARAVWIWIRSLTPTEAGKFVNKQLVPKLEKCLMESFPRDKELPVTQTRQILLAVLRWYSVIQEETVAGLFLQAFFLPWFTLNINDRYQLEKMIMWTREWTKTIVKEKQTSEELAMSRILGHIDLWLINSVLPFLNTTGRVVIKVEPVDNELRPNGHLVLSGNADEPLDLSMKNLTVSSGSENMVPNVAANYQVRQKLRMHLMNGKHISQTPILVE